MSEEKKGEEQSLSGQEVSAFRSFMDMLGLGAKAAPKAEPAAPAAPAAPAPAAEPAKPAEPTPEVKAAAAAEAQAKAQEQLNAMVLEAFKAMGAGLTPRAPAASKVLWPTTQREALKWASGTDEQRKALAAAVSDGFKYGAVPKF